LQRIDIPTYGAFCLDPGGSSGLAWARVRDEGTVAERIAAIPELKTATVSDPNWMAQARVISQLWFDFRRACHKAGLPAYFVCEDFILTRFKSSDRTGLYPVWVAAAIVGYRNGLADGYESGGFGPAAPVETVWQQPGQAKGYATDERLKRWGLWIKGREHERDACRHLAHFIASQKSQRMRLARSRARVRA
jgi:hypothetical protein